MASYAKNQLELNIEGEKVIITNIEKIIWPEKNIKKYDYLQYLTAVGPLMLPFLMNRLLTVIRYPNGVDQESFYQKNCPPSAPDFVDTKLVDDHNYIICSKLPTLLWLGNQSSVEFHIPFQTIKSKNPSEIVFDLDPPSQNEFHLAIEAALILKEIFDKLKLICFVKTSGNKGLQLYLPLNEQFTYSETRLFTQFIATYLETKFPKWFTTERLKKKRNNRLYIDFIQHGEGKTIVAPYSVRGNKEALVATPLYWKEVNSSLHPTQFSIDEVIQRGKNRILPFEDYFDTKKKQPFRNVLENLKGG